MTSLNLHALVRQAFWPDSARPAWERSGGEPWTATIGGNAATVSFSGPAPGLVGVYQVNIIVPANAPVSDAVPLALSIGGLDSNKVTLAVQ